MARANQFLFDPANHHTLPANVLYSPEPYFDDRPDVLQDIARELFGLKWTDPDDEELEAFADAVTDEHRRAMRLPLPRSLSRGREAYLTTCLVQPSHLPGGYVADGLFPIVIRPEATVAVMVLPARYWPAELRENWLGEASEGSDDRF